MSLIEIRNLRKEYSSDVVPLKGVNADIEAGEVISIIGPSGTGKSTLLRCINRLETPTSGQIIVDGTDVCAPGAWEWSFSPSTSFPTKWLWKISWSPSRAFWANRLRKPMRKP